MGQKSIDKYRGKTRTQKAVEIEARWNLVAKLYREGIRQDEMPAIIGVSQGQISKDIAALRAKWAQARVEDVSAGRERELLELASINDATWAAFNRSCKGGKVGDPRLLERLIALSARRCKILGLDAPQKIAGPDGGPLLSVIERVIVRPEGS